MGMGHRIICRICKHICATEREQFWGWGLGKAVRREKCSALHSRSDQRCNRRSDLTTNNKYRRTSNKHSLTALVFGRLKRASTLVHHVLALTPTNRSFQDGRGYTILQRTNGSS